MTNEKGTSLIRVWVLSTNAPILPTNEGKQTGMSLIVPRAMDYWALASLRRFFQSCQLLMMFCQRTYDPGPTDETGVRKV